jgi:hypothetical protein
VTNPDPQHRPGTGHPLLALARDLTQRLAARASGDTSVPGIDSVAHYIYRWEKGKNHLTDRYRLHYCRALHIAPRDFGPGPPPSLAALPALLATQLTRWLEAHASQARPAGTTSTQAQAGTAIRDNRAPTTAR